MCYDTSFLFFVTINIFFNIIYSIYKGPLQGVGNYFATKNALGKCTQIEILNTHT